MNSLKVTLRVECPRCSAEYEQLLYRRPRGLFLPPSRCGACGAPWAPSHRDPSGVGGRGMIVLARA